MTKGEGQACVALPFPPALKSCPFLSPHLAPWEQSQLANERVAALLEDRRIRDEEEQAHRSHLNQQLEAAAQKLRKTEEMLRQATKDAILGECSAAQQAQAYGRLLRRHSTVEVLHQADKEATLGKGWMRDSTMTCCLLCPMCCSQRGETSSRRRSVRWLPLLSWRWRSSSCTRR